MVKEGQRKRKGDSTFRFPAGPSGIYDIYSPLIESFAELTLGPFIQFAGQLHESTQWLLFMDTLAPQMLNGIQFELTLFFSREMDCYFDTFVSFMGALAIIQMNYSEGLHCESRMIVKSIESPLRPF